MALCLPIKAAIRGYSETGAANLTASERRERTTKRVGLVAKAVYICLQLLCLTILLQSDSTLGHNWRSSTAIYAWSFFASICLNFVLYLALCTSNPGYLPLPTVGEESVALNSKAHSEDAHLDHDTGLDTPVRVQPLPYPTNHANYINLAALGRNPASETRLEVPWWNLPRPGRWCEHCHAWQELRAKHCHVCMRCIRRFDHHCAWTGNCIGENNHARFWWFLTFQGMLITWALLDAISAWNLHPELDHGLLPGFKILLVSFLLFVTFLFDWGLWIYHTFLLATGRTTNEHIFRRNGPVAYLQHVPRKVSAFDQGLLNNVYNICCAKDPGEYKLPHHNELLQSAQVETFWDNRYYSCCR